MKTLGTIYGDGRYTAASDICTAALHAGALPVAGGQVTVHTDGGCKRFPAAQKKGVTSREFGAHAASYGFAKPLPACAN